ncbi:GlxA family transcriptional regulator [Ideonella sp. B508-1]|uniref:GlxA family transcriptional regulator n=1 Tax=Ideonella sp. B508-1 TaxID=137716 RepID=UPI000344934F|nr:helix-turn-helix domain-containing protein [Ideonella sp. B508-1]
MNLWFLVLPDTLLLDLAGPAEAFRLANQQLARRGLPPAFALHYISPTPDVLSSVGLPLGGLMPLPATLPPESWVWLLGRPGEASKVIHPEPAWLTARDWLNRTLAPLLQTDPSPCRLLTVCSGALLAADAGLLAHREATTHHELLDELARLAPRCRVRGNRVFVQDGPVWSSAGITAGIDLALHLVAEVLGEGPASAVAQVMVVFHRRGQQDPEHSPLLTGRRHLHPAVHAVQNAVVEAPGEDWSLARMAAVAHVTPRHLTRLFQLHAGVSPRQHVEQVRLALAREAHGSGMTRERAADLAGFSSTRQWRRARTRQADADPGPTDPGSAAQPR